MATICKIVNKTFTCVVQIDGIVRNNLRSFRDLSPRLESGQANSRKNIIGLVAISYPHVHIVQIHRADELEPPERVAVLTCLNANNVHNFTIRHAHGRLYYSKINKYKLGFMHNFGAFNA